MISSRTPEGLPNRCPVCRNAVCLEPSRPFGDAPCPNCGALLWFVLTDSTAVFFDPDDSEVVAWLAERLGGVDRDALRAGRFDELGIDSLDLVEVIAELGDQSR